MQRKLLRTRRAPCRAGEAKKPTARALAATGLPAKRKGSTVQGKVTEAVECSLI